MIIARIFQGLGNQMFQYAYSRALSLRHRIPLKLDLTYFIDNSSHRQYGLNRFNIEERIATPEEIYIIKNGIKPNRVHNYFFRRGLMFKPYYKQPYVAEDLSRFDQNLLKINSDTYVDGYYTSELYFQDFAQQIRRDFSFIHPPSERNREMISKIASESSVCLSIRRGDFVKNPLHDVCSLSYYHDAVSLMKGRISDIRLYIFSDDIDWVKQNFVPEAAHTFVIHNRPDFYEDFRLMQHCKHHIIPNSTFSWWAAWLSNYPSKTVIAPKYWLNSSEIDYSYYVPDDWIRLEHSIPTASNNLS